MARRTREEDAELIETADDLEELVQDKRQNWRANSSIPALGFLEVKLLKS